MPCWYYEKKDLLQTPSLKDGISAETEARYRRDGARFIIDAGTKMGLRYDTCATGVVYFHRFYMFHSFKEFHRFVTAACCLFLAGKVEETPKKCKDLVKITRNMLTDAQFSVFGEDPKEEVMTLERILLQTIKFDLMVEHPYAYLLKFAKLIKGDKNKVEKMVQMAWTFVNDSLCTTLSLQWEPEIIATALMYLTSRLIKFEIVDWQGKQLGYRGKWYEFLVEDITLELLEDICHQVLDLYSQPSQKGAESPAVSQTVSQGNADEQTPKTPLSPQCVVRKGVTAVVQTMETDTSVQQESPNLGGVGRVGASGIAPSGIGKMVTTPQSIHQKMVYSQTNPYMSGQMYSSSFMSQEGSQSIQSLIGVEGHGDYASGSVPYQQSHGSGNTLQYSSSAAAYQQPSQASAGYQQHTASYQQQSTVYQSQASGSSYNQPYSYTSQYESGSYAQQQQPAAGYSQSYLVSNSSSQSQPYGTATSPDSVSAAYQTYGTPTGSVPGYGTAPVSGAGASSRTQVPRQHQNYQSQPQSAGGLPSVRITGRHSTWR